MTLKILNRLINLLIVISVLLLINSCAFFNINKLENYNFSENNLYEVVAKEYKKLAEFELYEMHDELDANFFASKSLNILNKKKIYVENPDNWNIPDNYLEESKKEYKKINNLIENRIIYEYPEEVANLVTGYDCWLEQVEENWQLDHIANCKERFKKSFNKLTLKVADKEIKLAKIKEKNENINVNSSKKIKKKLNQEFIEAKNITIYFDFDSFILNESEKSKLDKIFDIKNLEFKKSIMIYGHTDTKGSINYNLKLSKKRAEQVKDYLTSKKITNDIKTKGYGEAFPVVDTGNEIIEEKNRRAEIIIN